MASFRSDAQGFLIGDLVETSRDLLRAQQESVRVWKAIHADVRAIARMMNVQASANNRLNQPGSRGPRGPYGPRPPALPPGRGRTGPGGSPTLGNAGLPGLPGLPSPPDQPAGRRSANERAERNSASGSTPVRRGANGRFLPGAGNAGPATPAGRGSNGRFTPGQGGTGGESNGGAETSGAISRLSDTIGGLSGALVSTENVDPTINAMLEVSDVVAPLGRGLFSLFGRSSEKKKERWYTKILKALTKRNEADGAGGAGSGTADGVRTGSFLGTLMGELVPRAVAFVAPLLMGIATAMMVGLGLLGAAALGTFVGGKIYDWLDRSGIAAKIFDAFDAVTGWFKEKYQRAKDGVTGLVNSAKEKVNSAVDSAKKTVSDFQKGATESAPVAPGARRPDGQVSELPPATSIAQRAGRLVGGAKNWVLGQTSKLYESGNGGAGTVSTGKGDHGGASYGTYQLSSKKGTLDRFLKNTGYDAQFAGLQPGSAEFNAKWKEIAKTDSKFGETQHDFIKKTHYEPMAANLKKSGIDIEGRGAAVKDAAWSTSVQFGGNSSLIQRALAGKDHSKMTDAEMVSAIQDYKAANNESLFKSSSPNQRAGTLARAGKEKDALLKLATSPTIPAGTVPPASRVVTAGLPSMPAANVPPSVPVTLPAMPDTPPPPVKLNSNAGAGRGTVVVKMPDQTGQNIGDRGIAHIVTGGLGAS